MTKRRAIAVPVLAIFLLAFTPPDCQALFGDLFACPAGTACVSSWNAAKQECVTRCEGPATEMD